MAPLVTPGRLIARVFVVLIALTVALGAWAAPASAHNSFESSEPTDGSSLTSLPRELLLRFAAATPLDTVQVDVINAAGAREPATGLTHGATDREVVIPLSSALSGAITARWRLVGSDGHVVSGRVSFTAPIAAVSGTPVPAGPAVTAPSVAPYAAPFQAPFETPTALRWSLRVAAFVSLVLTVGALIVAGHIWPQGATLPSLGLLARAGVAGLAVTAGGQLLVLASDVSGEAPLEAWAGLGTALRTDAGAALLARLLLVGVLALILFVWRPTTDLVRWTTAAVVVVGILFTWALAGHARSMRWPLIGVPLDVAHYGAAAIWMGGLVVIAGIVSRQAATEDVVEALQRFARIAALAVMVVVGTGILQAIRLTGGPLGLFQTAHGRLLALKLFPLGAMLYVADVNRRRVDRRFRRIEDASRPVQAALRRAMTTEAALGAGILMVTAALVVSPPATSQDEQPAPVTASAAVAGFDRELSAAAGLIRLRVQDPRAGRAAKVTVTPTGSDPATVALRAHPIARPEQSTERALERAGGDFTAELPLGSAGGWRVEVIVDGDRTNPFTATLPVGD